ncbi:glycosyltransferase [Maribacter sp. 2307ULW6-5]|uniref:glycosyltransferase n=1 Tax=Maribacter sp. 2307ULW6-5 TaxID=3386275 RepID=UPI0039BC9EA2
MTNILYVSTLCSERTNDYLFRTALEKPIQSAQKFHRLIVKGLGHHGNTKVDVRSTVPVVPSRHRRKLWMVKSQVEDGIAYRYLSFLNIRVLKNITLFFTCFWSVAFWSLRRWNQKRVMVTDVLNLTTLTAFLSASKLTGAQSIGIVTDMPNLMVSSSAKNRGKFSTSSLSFYLIRQLNGMVLLTEQMNAAINPKNRPYIVMEGLVDVRMTDSENELGAKHAKRTILYAGGLHEEYGIKCLIEGFMMLEDTDLELHLFGVGPMVEDIKRYAQTDRRIVFHGMVANNIVVAAQLKATLLINPRFSHEEFTKYSFPSKNMEYMVSGTPVLTTALPGMPKEYGEYVFLFEKEDVPGMYNALKRTLALGREELHERGTRAKAFVLAEKNNLKQADRILSLIDTVLGKQA